MTAALKQATQLKVQMNVVKGPHAGQVFHFNKSVITIGRGPENDIVLVNDPQVSRNHARVALVKNEFELINLSEKNALLFHGESVQKAVLINDSVFQLGETEIKFQFDLGQAVVSVPPKAPTTQASLSVVRPQVTPSVAEPKSLSIPVQQNRPQQSVAMKPQGLPGNLNPHPNPRGYNQEPPGQRKSVASTEESTKKLRFYLILGIIVVSGAFFYNNSKKASAPKEKAKPLLKYEDEVAISVNSQKEVALRKKREEDKKAKESPTVQRAEENFIKGMRDFQLGNYARAQDFFQVVLNLIPDHALARRHLYLSKVRFDELVQVKLVLGESYYQKHNFDMCVSMYQQVLHMLQGKSSDQKFQLAQRMIEKCQMASEGIR